MVFTNPFKSRGVMPTASTDKPRFSVGVEISVLAISGLLSCISGFILNGDTTKISILSQNIGTGVYSWFGNIGIFFGSPLLFFAIYMAIYKPTTQKSLVSVVLILYGIFLSLCGYFISQDQNQISSLDNATSSSIAQIYGWGSFAIGILMLLYGLYLVVLK